MTAIRQIVEVHNRMVSLLLPEDFPAGKAEVIVLSVEVYQESPAFTPPSSSPSELPRRQPGSAAGELWIADDFDAPLEDFREYME
jgi:Protein of unknown function (DUF2281)